MIGIFMTGSDDTKKDSGFAPRDTEETNTRNGQTTRLRVLVACEESGVVRDAFNLRGHDAWSCDLLDRPGKHITGNVREYLLGGWDLMIAHPPCTRLCNSGVCWLSKRNLWLEMEHAAQFFSDLLDAPIPRKALENPIPHKYALAIIGRKYDQIIQPYQFGHPERKATCLWLENLPLLRATNVVPLPKEKSIAQRIHYLPPSPERAMLRSKTFPGIAKAMADQWGCLSKLAGKTPTAAATLADKNE